MAKVVLYNLGVLLLMILFTQASKQEELKRDDTKQPERQHLYWMGPRFGGRRKRDPVHTVNTAPVGRAEQEQVADMLDVIRESPWAIIAINEGKRHSSTVNFTPRLGRESAEQDLQGFLEADAAAELQRASPPFAPRLGRRLSYAPWAGAGAAPDAWD